MYNRYIGNTGKVVRVEEAADRNDEMRGHSGAQHEKEPGGDTHKEPRGETHSEAHDTGSEARRISGIKKPPFLSGLGGGLVKSIDSALPFGLETADLVLMALFLFLYLESGDEEFLIILGFLAYSVYKDYQDKE